jgi:hypothetical protein
MVLCALLWMRSYHYRDWLKVRVLDHRAFVVVSGQGGLKFSAGKDQWLLYNRPQWRRVWIDETAEKRRVWIESEHVTDWMKTYYGPRTWTFDFDTRLVGWPREQRHTIVTVRFPHWASLILLGIGPGFAAFRGLRRFRRIRLGRCLACGYDLTGNVSGRCPECGLDLDPQVTDKHTSGETSP